MKRRTFVKAGLAAAAATATGAVFSSRASAQDARKRPNVLFIMTDQQFAEAMSCRMGKQYLNTPVMDALAADGMLFSRAYSANPLCMPLRNSLFTGRYPHETGVTKNAPPQGGLDPKEFVCMGTYFRNAGYDTGYSGKWHLCFNVRDENTHGFEIMKARGAGGHDAGVAEGAIEFLGRKHEKPFLLVASFLNPHNICEWSRRLAGRKQALNCGEIGDPPSAAQLPPPPTNLAPPMNEPDTMTMMRKGYQVEDGPFPVGKYTVEDWRKHRWGYYRMIELVDAQIGRMLEALRKAGHEDNTLIVFTSDHGECAGAHSFNQKTVFYEESARVPLIVSLKGKTAKGACDKLINIGIDLLPTMMDFAGIEVPKKLPGRSLRALAMGEAVRDWRDHVIIENDMSQGGDVGELHPQSQGRMVRSERYKYCLYEFGARRESLVDMQADPGETKDLAADPEYHKTIMEHRKLLAAHASAHKDGMAAMMLEKDVAPRPFKPLAPNSRAAKKKAEANP